MRFAALPLFTCRKNRLAENEEIFSRSKFAFGQTVETTFCGLTFAPPHLSPQS